MNVLYYYATPIGRIGIAENGDAVTDVFLGEPDTTKTYAVRETPLLKNAAAQLAEYFAGKRKSFTVPLAPCGTVFQKAVWDALQEISYGKTVSYGDIARAVGKPKACRAVGAACHANPVLLLIPCHRVIGANGSLTGFGGGLPVKKLLLELEKEQKTKNL